MDTLTHALSGALLARATAPGKPPAGGLTTRQRVTLGMLAAAVPDLDFVVSYTSPLAYLYNHRGVTHSLLMLPLWAVLLGWLCAMLLKRDPGRWRAYAGVIALGIGIHILGDLITSFGTMVFAPLSDRRFEWSTTFIIDLWFSGIIIAALIASSAWRASRVPAVLGCAVLAGYVGLQYVLQQRAISFGEQYARASGIQASAVSAMPRPLSPFNWMVVVRGPERLHYSLISLARNEAPPPLPADAGMLERLSAPYMPPALATWISAPRFGASAADHALAQEAWHQPSFGFFRWFAAYPVLHRVERGNPSTCVWFEDLRFLTPGRSAVPFRYGLCRDGSDAWRAFELLGSGRRVAVY